MKVYAGEYIIDLSNENTLRVGHDFNKLTDNPMSDAFDFLAKSDELGAKGFSILDEGVTWKRKNN